MKNGIRYANPKVIAVTGGIGSGQSTVCTRLQERGCRIIDVDKKAKQIISRDAALQGELKKVFGNKIFSSDGKLDRKLLAQLAFKEESSTQRLNQLVHPRMVSEVVEEMESARFSGKYPLIVIDAALVYEINIEQMFDVVIVVWANLEKRIERVSQRDGLNRAEILTRIHRQIPLEDKKAWADYVIDNNTTIEELVKQTDILFDKLTNAVRKAKRIRV
jgi:dephospho-CoA kinase